MPKTDPKRLEWNKNWLADKKANDPDWAENRKVKQREANRLWRERNLEEARRTERAELRRKVQNTRHRDRSEDDPEYRDRKLELSREKYTRDRDNRPWFLKDKALKHACKKYGITVERYAEMFKEQHEVCAICSLPETRKINGILCRLSIDHDHKTGKARALLCAACNTGIGRFNDDPSLIQKGLDYLLSHGGSDGT